MPSPSAQSVQNTQNSFPEQPTGAVAECPFKQKTEELPSAPIDAKTIHGMTQKVAPQPASETKQKDKKDWIEIILVDMEGKPVPNVRYRITPPGGAPVEGRLNEHGQAGLYQIEAGNCKITFPDLDQDAWEQ